MKRKKRQTRRLRCLLKCMRIYLKGSRRIAHLTALPPFPLLSIFTRRSDIVRSSVTTNCLYPSLCISKFPFTIVTLPSKVTFFSHFRVSPTTRIISSSFTSSGAAIKSEQFEKLDFRPLTLTHFYPYLIQQELRCCHTNYARIAL